MAENSIEMIPETTNNFRIYNYYKYYRDTHKEDFKQYRDKWYHNNKESLKEYKKQYNYNYYHSDNTARTKKTEEEIKEYRRIKNKEYYEKKKNQIIRIEPENSNNELNLTN
jgi:hypothetical protein